MDRKRPRFLSTVQERLTGEPETGRDSLDRVYHWLFPGGWHEPVRRSHHPLFSRLHGLLSNNGYLGQNTFQPGPGPLTRSAERSHFQGGCSFSAKRLYDTFNVPVDETFNHTAAGQGLERLRELYEDCGYINFAAVPTLQLDKDRGTVVLTISLDDGIQFTFGHLSLAGQEQRAGEADALRNAWAPLSGKRYDSSLLRKWPMQNATFLPNDGQPLRHVQMHLDANTHQADIKLAFP